MGEKCTAREKSWLRVREKGPRLPLAWAPEWLIRPCASLNEPAPPNYKNWPSNFSYNLPKQQPPYRFRPLLFAVIICMGPLRSPLLSLILPNANLYGLSLTIRGPLYTAIGPFSRTPRSGGSGWSVPAMLHSKDPSHTPVRAR